MSGIIRRHPDQAHWDKIHSGEIGTLNLVVTMDIKSRYSYGRGAHQREKASLQPGHKDREKAKKDE